MIWLDYQIHRSFHSGLISLHTSYMRKGEKYFSSIKKKIHTPQVLKKIFMHQNQKILTGTHLNPAIAFWIIDSSELLSNTNDKAATVGPQIRVNRSWSNEPEGTCRKKPSFVVPLFSSTYKTKINMSLYFRFLL